MEYTATFYTHFAAQTFARRLKKLGLPGKMAPTPRALSASCGTCVIFTPAGDYRPLLVEDTEAVYALGPDGYSQIWQHA